MCKEGIRIGRQTATLSTTYRVSGFGDQPNVLLPNPQRTGISLTGVWQGDVPPEGVQLYRLDGADVIYLGAITPVSPTLHMSIEQRGQEIGYGYNLQNSGGDGAQVTVTEHYLTEELSQI